MRPEKIMEIMLETSKSFHKKGLIDYAKDLENMIQDYSRAIKTKTYETTKEQNKILEPYTKKTIIKPKTLEEALKNQKTEETEKWALSIFATKNMYLEFIPLKIEKTSTFKKQKENFYLN